jgi:glutaredoxin
MMGVGMGTFKAGYSFKVIKFYNRGGGCMSDTTRFTLPLWFKDLLADPFKRYLIIVLSCLAIWLLISPRFGHKDLAVQGGTSIDFFFNPQCPHCAKQKVFNASLRAKYPELSIIEHDTSSKEQVRLLAAMLKERGYGERKLTVPVTFIGPYTLFGFKTNETTGVTIEKALNAYLKNDPSLFQQPNAKLGAETTVTLPLFGEIRIADYSLPVLSVIIGLVDGFNPCAMWVLVYLISLIVSLNDRRKIWLLVGTFVFASGALYFQFMTAWLNLFLFIGYLRFLTVIIGVAALGIGILDIREYLTTKGDLACKVADAGTKKRTMGRMERIVSAPITYWSFASVVILAFIVNSIEFACSAALPAIFTQTLALRKLPTLEYYGYILLYDFFYMLDDMIIFSLAALALDTTIGNRYAKHCKIIGGVVLTILGLLLAFKPEWLR